MGNNEKASVLSLHDDHIYHFLHPLPPPYLLPSHLYHGIKFDIEWRKFWLKSMKNRVNEDFFFGKQYK